MSDINQLILNEANRAEQVMMGGPTANGNIISLAGRQQLANFAQQSGQQLSKVPTTFTRSTPQRSFFNIFNRNTDTLNRLNHIINQNNALPMRDKVDRLINRASNQETFRTKFAKNVNFAAKKIVENPILSTVSGIGLNSIVPAPGVNLVGPPIVSAGLRRTAKAILPNTTHIEDKTNIIAPQDKQTYLSNDAVKVDPRISNFQNHLNPNLSKISTAFSNKGITGNLPNTGKIGQAVTNKIDEIRSTFPMFRKFDKVGNSLLKSYDHISGTNLAATLGGDKPIHRYLTGIKQNTVNAIKGLGRFLPNKKDSTD